MTKLSRIVQLLGMMGSAHDGEVLNAARLAQRTLGELGLTWAEVVSEEGGKGDYTAADVELAYQTGHASGYGKGYAEAKADSVVNGPMPFQSWRGVAQDLLDNHDHLLTEWERGFFGSYLERRWGTPTDKQRAIFERVADKVGVGLPP